MTGPRMVRVTWFAAALALTGCAGDAVATPATTPNYLQEYADAGSALDTATTPWDALGQALAPANMVRNDLAGVATGAVTTAQFVSDESNLQAAINVVQQELGLGSSTPIAG